MTNTFSFYCFVAVEKGPLNTAKIIFAVEIFIARTTLRLDQQTLNPTILERLWTMPGPYCQQQSAESNGLFKYSKTPWDTAPWHTIFADTLFWFRDKNFQDTLFFKFFTNLKVHYFQKCVKTLFNLPFLS